MNLSLCVCVCEDYFGTVSFFFFFGWAMLYGLNGLESRQKILMGINSLFFFSWATIWAIAWAQIWLG